MGPVMAGEFTVTEAGPGELILDRDGRRIRAFVAADGDAQWVFIDGRTYRFERVRGGSRGSKSSRRFEGALAAPMPATVIKILAAPGQAVKAGQTLVLLEAMKMELPLKAPKDGTVTHVACTEGELVQPGRTLVEIA
jgi:3-methylcrotonyl-CoA carboxylase alpha subunit